MAISTIGTNSFGATANAPTATALSTASGSAPSYAARAWVNFNGTGTVAIRASGNVTSITDNGTGDYTLNFTTALSDANYAAVFGVQNDDTNGNRGAGGAQINGATAPSTTVLRIFTAFGATAASDGAKNDQPIVNVTVFR